MNETTEILRLVLAAIFVVAGVAKLWDLAGAREAIRSFGVPASLSGPSAIALPVVELALAVLLLLAGTARVAAVAAAALFAAFAFVVALARLRGRTPDCQCFGRLHAAPAGWGVVGRNIALAVITLLVVSQPASAISTTAGGVFAISALVLGQAILTYALLRRYGRALRRIEELESRRPALEVGAEAPVFAGLPSRGRQALLVFTAPGCGPCKALLPRVAQWKQDHAHVLAVTVVEDAVVAERYGIYVTPSAVLVGADGRIEQARLEGADAIEQVVESLTATPMPIAAPNANRRLALAGAAAGAVAVAAGTAQAAPQHPSVLDPELQAIDAALKAAAPRLLTASQRSLMALRAQATLKTGETTRAKQNAAREALAAERRQVLALRAAIAKLPATGVAAHNVKVSADNSLSLLAQSLARRQQAVGATPKTGTRLLGKAQRLFLKSMGAGAVAGKLLGRGQ